MNYEKLLKKHMIKVSLRTVDSPALEENDIVTVWFNKQLQNAKGLFFVEKHKGMYYEVTYDGDKKVAYIDCYRKLQNIEVSLDD